MIIMEEYKNAWAWVLVAVALLFLFGSFGMGGYGMIGFGMGFGFIFMLLFWGGLLWLIVNLISTGKSGVLDSARRTESPTEILKRRYARGEINKKEFEEKKKDLI